MKKILIPTNFSQNSKNSIYYGINLALKNNMEVILLHVFDLFGFGMNYNYPTYNISSIPGDIEEEAANDSTKLFEEFMKKARKDFENLPTIVFLQKNGTIVDQILFEEKRLEVDMIIVSGRKDLNEISEINSKIIEEANCPIYIVSPQIKFTTINNIIYATNYKEKDLISIKHLSNFAKVFDAKIYAFHMVSNYHFKNTILQKGFEQMLKEAAQYPNIEVILKKGDHLIPQIHKIVEELKADLVVMLKENDSFFHNIFHSSSTKKFAFDSNTPVLIYHE